MLFCLDQRSYSTSDSVSAILGRVNHLGTEPATEVNSAWAIPPWVGKVSTIVSWAVNRHIV